MDDEVHIRKLNIVIMALIVVIFCLLFNNLLVMIGGGIIVSVFYVLFYLRYRQVRKRASLKVKDHPVLYHIVETGDSRVLHVMKEFCGEQIRIINSPSKLDMFSDPIRRARRSSLEIPKKANMYVVKPWIEIEEPRLEYARGKSIAEYSMREYIYILPGWLEYEKMDMRFADDVLINDMLVRCEGILRASRLIGWTVNDFNLEGVQEALLPVLEPVWCAARGVEFTVKLYDNRITRQIDGMKAKL